MCQERAVGIKKTSLFNELCISGAFSRATDRAWGADCGADGTSVASSDSRCREGRLFLFATDKVLLLGDVSGDQPGDDDGTVVIKRRRFVRCRLVRKQMGSCGLLMAN